MIRTTALLVAAIATAAACAPISARPLVDIDVVDRNTGEWLPEYRHRGQTWIPGTPGHRYSLRLTNNTGERVLVVVSVDGVNAVSGETAGAQQTGYVLGPWQSTEIAGWRKSLREVAQFYFTDLPDSYAARTGRPNNVGVIGAAVFRERQRYVPYDDPAPIARDERYHDRNQGAGESERRERSAAKSAPAPSAARGSQAYESDAMGQSIGTGHGQREWSPVGRTHFERDSRYPAEVVQLRYDDVPNLVAMGVMPRPHRWDRRYRDRPEAFPNGFAADPPRRW